MATTITKKLLLEILPDAHVKALVDVVDGATNYWLARDHDYDFDTAPDDVMLHGIAVESEDDEFPNGKPVTITVEQIREAYGKLLDLDQRYLKGAGNTIHGYIIDAFRDRDADTGLIDLGYIDGDAYDVIMQVAAFDEVIYG
jgi:hypothetical protein